MSDGQSVKRGVIYARVSSEEQEKEGYSVPSQNRHLQRPAVGTLYRDGNTLCFRVRQVTRILS